MKYLLLLDYDGTLIPIRKRPTEAKLPMPRRLFLEKLSRHPEMKIAIISGRKLSDLKRMIGIPRLIYVGNHGLEIKIGGNHWIHPAAKKLTPVLKKIKTALKQKLSYRGLLIEDKGLTLSIHYRLLPARAIAPFKRDFRRAIKPWKRLIRITPGKKVIEIRPPVDWDKGKAVKWIINKLKLKSYLPVYIGDDQTDEDAFLVLKRCGLTFKVGRGGKTLARGRLKNVAEVYPFLNRLVRRIKSS